MQATAAAEDNANLQLVVTSLNAQIHALRNSAQSQDENYHQLETSHATLTNRHKTKLAAAVASVETEQCKFLAESQRHEATSNALRLARLQILALEKEKAERAESDNPSPITTAASTPATAAQKRKGKATTTTQPPAKRKTTAKPFFPQATTTRAQAAKEPPTPIIPTPTPAEGPPPAVPPRNTFTQETAESQSFHPSGEDDFNNDDINDDNNDNDNDETSHHSGNTGNTAALITSIQAGSEIDLNSCSTTVDSRPRTKLR